MRLIKPDEVKKTAEIFSEIFKDYAAYDVMFKRDGNQKNKIYYFFCYEIFVSQKYTYVYDDFSAIAAVKKPGDIDTSVKKFFFNPVFAAEFYLTTGAKAIRLAKEYIEFADSIAKKYYVPSTDCYVKNIGVKKECRGQGRLTAMLNQICGNSPVYLETHDANNVQIYKKLGFELCEAAEWHGVVHYAMRRK